MLSIEDMATFAKKKGFVYRSSDIYGGLAGFWDFGPLGVEMFTALKASWWKYFVQSREDVVGVDASIISHPMTWKASGHLESFGDLMLVCSKCKHKVRADHFIEEKTGTAAEGLSAEEINKVVTKEDLVCPSCKSLFNKTNDFNLMFETNVGASVKNKAYLRGETAQGMFMNFRLVADTMRMQLPFGIAQIGRCFRNEISPRDFLFRSREFHIGEIEYFMNNTKKKCDLLTPNHLSLEFYFLSAEAQGQKGDIVQVAMHDLLEQKRLTEWHAYFLAEQYFWLLSIGLSHKKLKIREHVKNELSHYSSATFDIDYEFPFGSKEIAGNANRGKYDLEQHIKHSKKKLNIFDEASKAHILPEVIEPTFGLERVFLALLFNAYCDDKQRGNIVLKLAPMLAPIKVAVFPLVNKNNDKAREVFDSLKNEFTSMYDKSGSIGRRYARADEIGIPYCVTIDFEEGVTIRDRDTTGQVRVAIEKLKTTLQQLLAKKLTIAKGGTTV